MIHEGLHHLIVPIESLTPWPANARRGDLRLLQESLSSHGQYSPVVIDERGRIIAGNHLWQAAQALGWTEIAAVEVSVDETTARRIALVDNQSADLAFYDDPDLLAMLEGLPDLQGTGYSDADVDRLRESLEDGVSGPRGGGGGSGAQVKPDVVVKVGAYGFTVAAETYDEWKATFTDGLDGVAQILTELREQLAFPPEPVPPTGRHVSTAAEKLARLELKKKRLADYGEEYQLVSGEIPIDSVHPARRNARRGDGAIIGESLTRLGQYRPIVVNKRTGDILKGNHTWKVAKAQGWEDIAAVFVDVDEEEAERIILVDNRSSDLAANDTRALLAEIDQLPDLDGTGFDDFEVEALFEKVDREDALANAPAGDERVTVSVGSWRFTVGQAAYDEWHAEIQSVVGSDHVAICGECAARLGFRIVEVSTGPTV